MIDNKIIVKVDGQKIKMLHSPEIIEDSVNYLTLQVSFSKEWENLKKTVIFTNYSNSRKIELPRELDLEFLVPYIVIHKPEFSFGFYGESNDEKNYMMITTEPKSLEVKESIFEEEDHTISVYDPYGKLVSDIFSGELTSVKPLKKITYIKGERDYLELLSFDGQIQKVFLDKMNEFFSSFEYENSPFLYEAKYSSERLIKLRDTEIDFSAIDFSEKPEKTEIATGEINFAPQANFSANIDVTGSVIQITGGL